jgi:S-adenosylmethionine:tRNA ribosyltransferase-isomerase
MPESVMLSSHGRIELSPSFDRLDSFFLPPELSADRPPERRGLVRDRVRLLVIDRQNGEVTHTRFDRLTSLLRRDDLLVFNASRTLPAALSATTLQVRMEVRLAERLPDETWLALLLDQSEEHKERIASGLLLDFGRDLTATVIQRDERVPKLWRVQFSKTGTELLDSIYRLGQPIRYRYVSAPWSLNYYQNIYANQPGASEMPSAGRPFSWRLLFQLRRIGVDTASITLHTGLSSYMDDEIDRQHIASEEEYRIGEMAIAKIRRAQQLGGRIIAVGTTVVRALESMISEQSGKIEACHRYTRLKITDHYRLRLVNGLLTGLHEPEASHLDLLSAFIPVQSLRSAYAEAIDRRYLWHEFGDVNLIL